MVAEEAWKQLTDIQQRDILSQSQNGKLSDWLELMEEVYDHWNLTLVLLDLYLQSQKSEPAYL